MRVDLLTVDPPSDVQVGLIEVEFLPQPITITLTAYPAEVSGLIGFFPPSAPLAITGYQAGLAPASLGMSPGAATLAVTGYQASVATGGGALEPGSAALALTSYQPTLSTTPSGMGAGAATLSITGYQPVLSEAGSFTPGTTALAITGYQPTVPTGAVSFAPSTTTLAVTGYQASLVAGSVSLEPGAATLAITGYQPTLVAGAVGMAAGNTTLGITGYQPAVAETVTPEEMVAGTLSLNIFKYQPTVSLTPTDFAPSSTTLAVTGYQATLAATELVAAAGTTTLAITGYQPTVTLQSAGMTAGNKSLAITAYQPTMAAASAGITYVGGDFQESSTGADLTMTLPTVQTDDFILLLVGADDNDKSSVTLACSGYTALINADYHTNDGLTCAVFYKFATSASEADPVVTEDEGEQITCVCLVFRGVNKTTPFDVTTQVAEVNSAPDTANPAITPTTDNGALVLYSRWSRNRHSVMGTPSTPTGLTQGGSSTVGNQATNSAYKVDYGTAATITPGVWNNTYANTQPDQVAFTIALRPA